MSETMFLFKDNGAGELMLTVATPAEIRDAHPKCGTCRYYDREPLRGAAYGYCRMIHVNMTPRDYCRHHEPTEHNP